MTKYKVLISLIFFLFSGATFAFSPKEQVVVAFPQIQLQKGERVVEFDLTVRSGQVIGVNNIPKDWSIDVAAEQSSETKITGGCRHGAGALNESTELPTFAVVVEKPLEPSMEFSAKAKIRVSSDFENTREIEVAAGKMVIRIGSI